MTETETHHIIPEGVFIALPCPAMKLHYVELCAIIIDIYNGKRYINKKKLKELESLMDYLDIFINQIDYPQDRIVKDDD